MNMEINPSEYKILIVDDVMSVEAQILPTSCLFSSMI